MEIKLEKRRLNDKEIDLLIEEIKKFPNPLTGKKTWQALKKVYIVRSNGDLIGVCGTTEFKDWLKIGPFVVFKKFHNRGFGKKIFNSVVNNYSHLNLYVGSRNPAVAKIALGSGFKEEDNIWKLPKVIKMYLINNILGSINLNLIREFFRKSPMKEGPYRNFIKQTSI